MKSFKPAAIAVCLILFVLACNNPINDLSKNEDLKNQKDLIMEEKLAPLPKQHPPVNEKGNEAEQTANNYRADTIQSPGQTQQTLPVTKNNPASTPDWNKMK